MKVGNGLQQYNSHQMNTNHSEKFVNGQALDNRYTQQKVFEMQIQNSEDQKEAGCVTSSEELDTDRADTENTHILGNNQQTE